MKINFLPLMACSFLLVGCASTGPTGGVLFHDIKYGVNATPNYVASKNGEACQNSILGLFGFGDASIDAAKKASGITKVSSIDASSLSVLGLYNKYCTIIKGE
jgi:hypothetical protein